MSVLVFGTVIFGILFLFLLTFTVLILVTLLTKDEETWGATPSVSVLLPAYNEAHIISDCIQSIKDNNYDGETEIIVVDDGSTDGTLSIINNIDDVKVLKQSHNGKVPALNKAYNASSNEIIVAADADTIVDETFLERITTPFKDDTVGAVSGAVTPIERGNILNAFQTVEYHYNNLIRNAISYLFNTDIWFFGCIAAYRRQALNDIDGFPHGSLTEDMDIVIQLRRHRWKTLHEPSATGTTEAPDSVQRLAAQRQRWWGGGYQLLRRHRDLLFESGTFTFIFFHHWWWALYAITSVPLLAYQYSYWVPSGIASTVSYSIRWVTLLGPIYVLYNATNGWLNIYNAFGVFSGVITAGLILVALSYYNKTMTARDVMALFLYFPYTILLNGFILLGVYEATQRPHKTYVG